MAKGRLGLIDDYGSPRGERGERDYGWLHGQGGRVPTIVGGGGGGPQPPTCQLRCGAVGDEHGRLQVDLMW
jgi:hypothetical protein